MEEGNRKSGEGTDRATFFAPAGRASAEVLAEQVARVVLHPVTKAILESFCGHVLVLNRQRQILGASPELQEALSACGIDDVVGLRPGEALGCEHVSQGPDGCGTSPACRHCGAVMAILTAQCCSEPVYDECWISMRRNGKYESAEFRAKATPLSLAGSDVVVLALADISDQKRRVILEQSLLHDVRNLLGGILSWSEILKDEYPDEATASLYGLAMQVRDLLFDHTLLAKAERGQLVVSKQTLDLDSLRRALQEAFSRHPSGDGKNLVVYFSDEPAPVSDAPVVRRILTNMISNALEASSAGASIQVGYKMSDGMATFTVNNPGVIAADIASRIFMRSFTTKKMSGHGLGTYSMRLFAEQYLGGSVGFSSTPEQGTTFWLKLP